MSVRASMSDLITRVRRYIGDPAQASEQFTDQEIQNVLDEHRFTVRYAPLRPGPTLSQGALYDFLDYYADMGNWEADAVLTWVDFSVLTPATSDLINGHWTFVKAAPGQYPPVYLTGKYYDLHASAADLLEQWAGALAATNYDFTADGRTFRRSQLPANLYKAADMHRRKALVTSAPTYRGDLSTAHPEFSLGQGGPGDVTGAGE